MDVDGAGLPISAASTMHRKVPRTSRGNRGFVAANAPTLPITGIQNDEWYLQRPYLQLEGLQALAENQPARLSAVVS